jgi:anti-sigma regulatory factor (Ser/Thr protein kinase)
MEVLGANPARIIPAWEAFVAEHAGSGRRLRGIGEPVWAGREGAALAECQLHESLLNIAVDRDTSLLLRCPYDAEAVGLAVVYEALRSHPVLAEAGGTRESTRFEGAQQAESLFASELPAPPPRTEELSFGPQGLSSVRDRVSRSGYDAGLPNDRVSDLKTAVNEIATNSIRHGGGYGVLRIWRKDRTLVCEISDAGHIKDPLAGRRRPAISERPGQDQPGRGLWLVNQLCDLVQLRSSPKGTTTRVLSTV